MTCEVCKWIGEKKNLLFEDDDVFVMLAPEPCAPGHMFVITKKHAPIMESIPDDVMGQLFLNANKASVCAFESLQAQGTNILVQNGLPAGQKFSHAIVQVVPRFENDGLPLVWQPVQLTQEQLSDVESKFKAAVEPEVKVEKRHMVRRIP